MSNSQYQVLRNAMLEHGNSLKPNERTGDQVRVTALGSGGVQLNRAATEILISILSGDDDYVVVDKHWMRHNLERLDIESKQADMLLDRIPPRGKVAVMIPLHLIASAE